MAVDPARSDELIARGLEIMAAINARRRARAPRGPADLRLPPRRLLRGRPGRRAQRHRDPPRLAGPLAVRHRHLGADGRSCTPAASWRSARTFVNESVIGTRFTGRLVEETTVGGLPAVVPEITGRAWVTGHGPVPARRRATRSPPASRCELAGRRRGRRRDRRRLRGARARARRRDASRCSSAAAAGARAARGATPACSCPSHARPIAAPESLRAGLGWMVEPDSPFGLKLKPSLAPWLARYLRASTGAARGATARRCSASSAARASARSASWRPRGSTAASTSRAA